MHFITQFTDFFTSAFRVTFAERCFQRKNIIRICFLVICFLELLSVQVNGEESNKNEATSQSTLPDSAYNGCDTTKTCFGLDNCVPKKSCRILLVGRMIANKNIVEFELYGKFTDDSKNEWFAMGVSNDKRMGDDSVTDCIAEKDEKSPVLKESWNNENYGNENYDNGTINVINKEKTNGVVKCVWQRNITTTVKGKIFDLSNSYILLATGFTNENGLTKLKHNVRGYSDSVINFKVTSVVESGKVHFLIKIHGSLMIIIWLGTVSVGIMIARHYKNVWKEKTLLGQKVWFTCHRGLMITSIALALVSMTCIFIMFKIRIVTVHSYFGVLANTLMFLQPVGAYFRPHPGTENRWMFNWGHWFGGNVAQISAVTAMFLAAYLPAAALSPIFVWLLVIFVILHIATHLIMQLHAWHLISKSKDSNEIPLNPSAVDTSTTLTQNGESFKQMMLGTYIVLLSVIILALIIVILCA